MQRPVHYIRESKYISLNFICNCGMGMMQYLASCPKFWDAPSSTYARNINREASYINPLFH